jgi:hypothetical protein
VQRGRDGRGLVLELAVCEAEAAVAGDGEDRVAFAVALEGGSGAVKAPAVGLDGEPVGAEHEVDLEAGDVVVDARPWQPVVLAEREEPFLEL